MITVFFGLIKKSPATETMDIMLDMHFHPEHFAETELIKQYLKDSNDDGIRRLAAEEWQRRKNGKSHHTVKQSKSLAVQNNELIETLQVSETIIKYEKAENMKLRRKNIELEAVLHPLPDPDFAFEKNVPVVDWK